MTFREAWDEIYSARHSLYAAAMKQCRNERAARLRLQLLISSECANAGPFTKASKLVPAILDALAPLTGADPTYDLPEGLEAEMKAACGEGISKANEKLRLRGTAIAVAFCAVVVCTFVALLLRAKNTEAPPAVTDTTEYTADTTAPATEPPATESPATEPPDEPKFQYGYGTPLLRTSSHTNFDGEHGVAVNREDRCGSTASAKDGTAYVFTVSGVDPAKHKETYTLYRINGYSFDSLCSIQRSYTMSNYGKYMPSVFVFCDKDSVPHVFMSFSTQLRCYAYDENKGELVLEGTVSMKNQYTDFVACADERGVYLADQQSCVYYDFETEKFNFKVIQNKTLPYVTDIAVYENTVLILGISNYDDVVLYKVTDFTSSCRLGSPYTIAEYKDPMPASCSMDVSADGKVYVMYTDRSGTSDKLVMTVMEKDGSTTDHELWGEGGMNLHYPVCKEVICSHSGEVYLIASNLALLRVYYDVKTDAYLYEWTHAPNVGYLTLCSSYVNYGENGCIDILYDTSQYAMTENTKTDYYYTRIYFY